MNFVILLFVAAASTLVQTREINFGYDDWHFVPNEDGVLQWLPGSEIVDPEPFFNAVTQTEFFLYTRNNPINPQQILLENESSILNSSFNANHPTRVIIHGWFHHGESTPSTAIRTAYMLKGNFNVIVVDWGAGADTINYVSARNRVYDVGPIVARFIDFAVQRAGLKLTDLSIIGHSLGAHIAGVTGKFVRTGRVRSIIGLDPSGFLFSLRRPAERLDSTDGFYVEIIHTNGDDLGFGHPIGDADFYPNGGESQPGCPIDVSGSCAHNRAPDLFAESITTAVGFWAVPCHQNELGRDRCSRAGPRALMGGEPSNSAQGVSGTYRLITNSRSPYARG